MLLLDPPGPEVSLLLPCCACWTHLILLPIVLSMLPSSPGPDPGCPCCGARDVSRRTFLFFIFPEKMASRQVIACAETFHHQAVLAPRRVSASLEPGFTASSHPATNRSAAETPLQKGVSDRVLPKGSSEGISPPAHVASEGLLRAWAICDPCPRGTGGGIKGQPQARMSSLACA